MMIVSTAVGTVIELLWCWMARQVMLLSYGGDSKHLLYIIGDAQRTSAVTSINSGTLEHPATERVTENCCSSKLVCQFEIVGAMNSCVVVYI